MDELHARLDTPFDVLVAQAIDALKGGAFGVPGDICVQAAFQAKLGEDLWPCRVIGASNPALAQPALQAGPDVGLHVAMRRDRAARRRQRPRRDEPDASGVAGGLSEAHTPRGMPLLVGGVVDVRAKGSHGAPWGGAVMVDTAPFSTIFSERFVMQRRLQIRSAMAAAAALFLAVVTGLAQAQAPAGNVVPGFGAIHTAPHATERPSNSLRYKVLFSVTHGNDDATKPNASLDKVARFMNLLAADGVRPTKGDVVAVMHGKATPIVMNDAAYGARNNGAANPNLELIDQLKKAGVSVRVCSQALAAASIAPEAVDKRVEIDVAALTTLANLQLRGYALIPD